MIKKVLTLCIMTFSLLFISPCYAMWGCCGGDEEPENPTQQTKLLDPQEVECRKQEAQKKKEEDAQKATQLEVQSRQMAILAVAAKQEAKQLQKQADALKPGGEKSKDDLQIITHGSVTVTLPKALTPMVYEDGSLSLSLNNFFYMRIYKNYDAAIENNADVKALHQIKMPLKSKDSLIRRMNLFYQDLRDKMSQNDKSVIEETIACIQLLVDEIPQTGPFLVKFGEDNSGSCAVLFPINVGVILMKGPAEQERPEQTR
jgi:hypothetical protein